MYNIFSIANWFLHKEKMNHKKVQKLCYFSQCWSLTINNRKLFDEKFEAWCHGPVCRELWNELNKYELKKIPKKTLSTYKKKIKKKDKKILKFIWNTYKSYDSIDLEFISIKGIPYKNARKGLESYQAGTNIIDEKDMSNCYLYLMNPIQY